MDEVKKSPKRKRGRRKSLRDGKGNKIRLRRAPQTLSGYLRLLARLEGKKIETRYGDLKELARIQSELVLQPRSQARKDPEGIRPQAPLMILKAVIQIKPDEFRPMIAGRPHKPYHRYHSALARELARLGWHREPTPERRSRPRGIRHRAPTRRLRSSTRRNKDLDDMVKALFLAMKGTVIERPSQVAELQVAKSYAAPRGLEGIYLQVEEILTPLRYLPPDLESVDLGLLRCIVASGNNTRLGDASDDDERRHPRSRDRSRRVLPTEAAASEKARDESGSDEGQDRTNSGREARTPSLRHPAPARPAGNDHSDLYKLGLSRFKRNVSWTDVPQIEELDHNHLFHTFNSDGKQQFYCTAVGGHFHLMEVFPGKDGEAPRVKCASGPLKWVQRKVRGRFTKVAEPVLLPEGEDEDNHVHETFYLGSTEVTKRMGNTVAAGIIAADAQKTAPIAGVRG
jgi:hypothetical protein